MEARPPGKNEDETARWLSKIRRKKRNPPAGGSDASPSGRWMPPSLDRQPEARMNPAFQTVRKKKCKKLRLLFRIRADACFNLGESTPQERETGCLSKL